MEALAVLGIAEPMALKPVTSRMNDNELRAIADRHRVDGDDGVGGGVPDID
jgi:hypothetical protein